MERDECGRDVARNVAIIAWSHILLRCIILFYFIVYFANVFTK